MLAASKPISSFALVTQRGNPKLEVDGRLFRQLRSTPYLNKDGSTSFYYACCKSGCSGKLTAYCAVGDDIIRSYSHENTSHSATCVPDKPAILLERAREKCSSLVITGTKRGYCAAQGDVVGELQEEIGPMLAAQFVAPTAGRKNVYRRMNKSIGHPPSAFQDLRSIPKEFGFNKKGQRFLLVFKSYFDESGEDCGPIIIFATREDLLALFNAVLIAVDGTFKIKPKPYASLRSAQVLTINSFFWCFKQ